MNEILMKTSSPAGDCISYLSGIKEMYRSTGKKTILYQRLDMIGISYDYSVQPFKNEEDEPITMNKYMFDNLRPLLTSQEYIEDYRIYDGEKVDFDFDLVRLGGFTNQPHGSLNRWFNYVFPQMASDLSKKWINVPKVDGWDDKVIINFTQRHRNHITNYQFLKNNQDKIVFVGLEKERDIFCKQHNLDIKYYEASNFYQLALAINSCKFFMGNASMCFQIAEGLKVPRILECFVPMPNVIPVGEYAYDFYIQDAVQYYYNYLINK